jgi:NAD(P)-dependent dehydrogenase (short-subunit alcohol dehydrogenase family)
MAQDEKQAEVQRILLIGGTGTVGSAVFRALQDFAKNNPNIKFEVLVGARKKSNKDKSIKVDVDIDITDASSIKAAFEKYSGKLDHVICCAGTAPFKSMSELTRKDFETGFGSKALGQIDLALHAFHHLRPNGSVTLTTGVLADIPIKGSGAPSAVNGAVHAFVKATEVDSPHGIRVNVVCAGLLTEAVPHYGPYFPGFHSIPGKDQAQAYIRSVFGGVRSKVIRINPAPAFSES